MTPLKSVLAIATLLILFTGLLIFGSRLFSPEEYDDAHPLVIQPDHPLIKRSEWIWVMPLYMGQPISNYPKWVADLKATGKKLGLHGVKHTFDEFHKDRDWAYIKAGYEEFKKAFGYYPTAFKAPKLHMTEANKEKIEDMGMEVFGWFNQIMHRVHHTTEGRLPDGRLPGEEKV